MPSFAENYVIFVLFLGEVFGFHKLHVSDGMGASYPGTGVLCYASGDDDGS